jgi:hypothetical protein
MHAKKSTVRCGALAARLIRGLAAAALVLSAQTGCLATLGELKTRASFDLSCPSEQLEIVYLDHEVVGVRGCGMQGSYLQLRCPGDCTWVPTVISGPR